MAGYATAIGNGRNAMHTAWPLLWRTDNYEYAIVTRVDWHLLVCQRELPDGEWVTHDVSGTQIGVIFAGDSHNAAALAVDGQGYIHISGNTHAEPLRYIRSANPHDITSWVNGTRPVNWTLIGNVTTYQAYECFSDGTLIWHTDQNYTSSTATGRKIVMWRLAPTPGAVWEPCVGTGMIMFSLNANQGNVSNSDALPDRAYIMHSFVDKDDVLHCVFVWRVQTSTPGSMAEHFYVKSYDKGTTWYNVYDEFVEAPFYYRDVLDGKVGSAPAAVTVGGDPVGGSVNGGRCVDKDGNFHYYVSGSGSPNGNNHVWFDGNEWQTEYITGYASPRQPTLSLMNGDVWMWHYRNTVGQEGFYGSNLSKRPAAAHKYRVRVANIAPPGTPDGEYEFENSVVYHPALTHAGGLENGRHVTRFMIPDGDKPKIYSFGNGFKHKTS